jgi:tRNA-dihydrouridine synthase B
MQLALAPLQGVTEYPFRNAWQKHFVGLDEAFSPFIPAVTGLKVKRCHVKDVLPEHQSGGMQIVPQILTNTGAGLRRMADALAALGYKEINLNMGCPSATVVRKGRGCGLMPFPDKVRQMVDEGMAETEVKLSVKLRLGMFQPEEIFRMIEVLNAFPLSRLIIHPRLGSWNYDGEPDLNLFEQALALSAHPVVYNGDINHLSFFRHLRGRFPSLTMWMVGRGVLMNPFLPGMMKGADAPDSEHARALLITFQDDLLKGLLSGGSSEQRVAAKMKEYWSYFSRWFEQRDEVWHAVSHAADLDEVKRAIETAFRGSLTFFH